MLRLLIASALVLMAGCASTPQINSNSNPNIDFTSFATYNFMQPLATDRPDGVQTPLSQKLMQAMSREMAARGYTPSDKPDLLINFFVVTEDRIDVRAVPTTGSFRGYRRNRYRTWNSYRTEVRQYTRGTLAVDLVDADQRVLAWEAGAQQRLGRSTSVDQEMIDAVLQQVMAEFEHRAP